MPEMVTISFMTEGASGSFGLDPEMGSVLWTLCKAALQVPEERRRKAMAELSSCVQAITGAPADAAPSNANDVFIPAEIRQSRGPALEFEGRLLACTEWTTRGSEPSQMRLELWETRGGAYIPVTRSEPLDGRRGIVSATVVEKSPVTAFRQSSGQVAQAIAELELAEAAMRFAVMDFWDWTDRARSMVRKELGWALKRVVE